MHRIFAAMLVPFFLVHFMVFSFPKTDMDQNGSIDLQDAILSVRGLVKISEVDRVQARAGKLAFHLGKVIQVFQVVAGEEKQVRQHDERTTVSAAYAFLALQPDSDPDSYRPLVQFFKPYPCLPFQSNDLEPIPPPPKAHC